MCDWLRKVARMISQKGGFFMFLRAQLSAQMATIADFLVTILLVRLFEVYYVYATLAGAVYGGIVNCVINYKWTFKSTGKKTNVAVKFILVWVCSIWLNTWGTYALTESLAKIPWVRDTLSQYFGDFFIVPNTSAASLFLLNVRLSLPFRSFAVMKDFVTVRFLPLDAPRSIGRSA